MAGFFDPPAEAAVGEARDRDRVAGRGAVFAAELGGAVDRRDVPEMAQFLHRRVVQLARPDDVDRRVAEPFEHPGGGLRHPRRGGEQDRRPGLGGEARRRAPAARRGRRSAPRSPGGAAAPSARASSRSMAAAAAAGARGGSVSVRRFPGAEAELPTLITWAPPSEAAPSGCMSSIASELTPGQRARRC